MRVMVLRALVVLTFCVALLGCSGEAVVPAPSLFAGTYSGTWTNVADPTDTGTSTWAVDASGHVVGQDFDPVRETTFDVVGQIDAGGHLVSTSTPRNGSGAASLNGPLQFNASGQLEGLLVWGIEPPLTYRYTFTRQ